MKNRRGRTERSSASLAVRYSLKLVRENSLAWNPGVCSRPETAARLAHEILAGFDREALGALFLNTRHHLIGYTIAYIGTLDRSVAEPRGLLVPALLANAAALIVFHNHPSGDPSPSAEDILFTRRLMGAAELVGLRCLDHLILGERPAFLSIRQNGSSD